MIAAVLIGRNEGERLVRCLNSVVGQVSRVVYVDSGSSDGSIEAARAAGAHVISLDTRSGFTAARARNAGLAWLTEAEVWPDYVQFLDGDCILQQGWIRTAHAFLERFPEVAAVCGRRRERFPEASLWNRLIDAEWDTPVGEARACGGDAMMRVRALVEAGGYNPDLIAGEEPELCVRLRQRGWKIWRLDAEMTLHDAAMVRFGQWWQRMRRGGHAYAEAAAMHGAPPERHGVQELRRIVFWGILLPAVTLAGALVSPWALLLVLIWPMQVLRLWRRGMPWHRALFLTLAKFPEAQGALSYWWLRLIRARARLIEYK